MLFETSAPRLIQLKNRPLILAGGFDKGGLRQALAAVPAKPDLVGAEGGSGDSTLTAKP
jgi:hypothetical protein